MRECAQCGELFPRNRKESNTQWARRRFCSRGCGARWRAAHEPRKRACGPCARCDVNVDGLVDGLCTSCWHKRRYREQRDRILAMNRQWREANPDYWRQQHVVDRVRKWHAEHPERVREITRAALRRRRARINGAPAGDPKATDAYANVLRGDRCSYCDAPAEHLDHIIAISRGGGHVWDNLTSACAHCNVSKYSCTLVDFLLARQRPQTGQGAAPARA